MKKSILLVVFIIGMFIITNLLYTFSEVRFLFYVPNQLLATLINLVVVLVLTYGIGYLLKTDVIESSKINLNMKMVRLAVTFGFILFLFRFILDVVFYSNINNEIGFIYSFWGLVEVYLLNLFVKVKEFFIFVVLPVTLFRRFFNLQDVEMRIYSILIPVLLFTITMLGIVRVDFFAVLRVFANITLFVFAYSYLNDKYKNIWPALLFIDVYLVLFVIKIGVLLPIIF